MKTTFFKSVLRNPVLLILFLPIGLPALSQPVKITINADAQKRQVSPYIFGKNNNLSDSPGNPLSQAQWQKFRDIGITMFRESGGNNSTKYNWRRKLTSHPDWYNNVYKHDWDFAAQSLQENMPEAQGMWAFQLIGKAAKSSASNFNDWGYNSSKWWSGVHQNLAGGGTVNPDGGAALKNGNPELYLENWPADSTVAILDQWFTKNKLGLDSTKIRYWGMDNEPEIWLGTHDDVMPEQISAEEFMQLYFEVAKKARAKFPGIKLCGPVPANEWQWYNWKNDAINYNGKKYTWLEYFILRVSEEQKTTGIRLLDVLDIHFYPGESKNEDIVQLHRVYFDRNYVYPGANGVKRIGGGWNSSLNKEYILGRCADWLTQYMGKDHGVTFGVSETGINSSNPTVCANWYASTLGEFAKQGVEFFTPWSWNTGMFEVLHLFSRYSHSNYVNAISENEEFVSAYPTMNKAGDSMTVILVNRHTSLKKQIQLDIKGFQVKNGPVRMLTLSNLPANETFVSHTVNALKSAEIIPSQYNISTELEPLSVNAVLLTAAPTANKPVANTGHSFTIFPNPATSQINLVFYNEMEGPVKIEMINSSGAKVKELLHKKITAGRQQFTFDVSENTPGIYWIRILSEQSNVTAKIIINQH